MSLSRFWFVSEPSILAETCLALQDSGSQSPSKARTAWDVHVIAQGPRLWPVLQWKSPWVGALLPVGFCCICT